jgi:uncharacterized protein (DUF1330 family)
MPAYVIGDITVTDPDRYKDYTAHTESTLEPFGGHFIVRGGAFEMLEGTWQPGRLVVIEFPSAQAARDWYGSEAYRAILPIRQEASVGSLALVEGYGALSVGVDERP